jgi:CBS-domain-containing membrane protein
MPRRIREELRTARKYWKNYVFQSLLATVSIFLVLIILDMDEAVLIASLGATAFVVFALPEKFTAHPRNVIGGHFVGLMCGFLGVVMLHLLPVASNIVENAIYALTVGLSIFIMTITDTEHPPAAGTAMGVVLKGFTEHPSTGNTIMDLIKSLNLQIMLQVMVFAVIFSLIRLILRKHLRDLT